MAKKNLDSAYLDAFILNALIEDIGDGDHTSLACIPSHSKAKATLLVKENGVLAGLDLTKKIIHHVDPTLKLKTYFKDGSTIKKGDIVFDLYGSAHSILKAERLLLNCMQRMSGIATYTAQLVKQCDGTNAKVIDTRKTTPGLRMLEKWAVRIGGGANHRFGLYDMMLIKDNHVDCAGGVSVALEKAMAYQQRNKHLPIEIETRNLNEVKEVLKTASKLKRGKLKRIMLDNFTPANLKKAVILINAQFETEASGGITAKTIRSFAKTGVDYISVGALTHSVKSIDLSLKAHIS